MLDQKPNTPGATTSGAIPPGGPTRFSVMALIASGVTVVCMITFVVFFGLRIFSPYIYILVVMGLLSFWLADRAHAEIRAAGGAVKGKWLATAVKLFSACLAAASISAGAGHLESFLVFNTKAKQSEAKTNLGSIVKAQANFITKNNRPAKTFNELGWKPEGSTLYAYFMDGDSLQPKGKTVQLPAAVKAELSAGNYAAAAVGNIDDDPTLDVWTATPGPSLIQINNDIRE